MYTISQFAKMVGVTKKTLQRWDKIGRLKPIKFESKHRRYTDSHVQEVMNSKILSEKINIIYCRESTKQQKNSLINQVEKCKLFALNRGITVDKVIEDYSSGLDYNRKGLQELLRCMSNNTIDNLIIYYKDRLMYFGFELIEQLSIIHNFNIIVIDDSESNKTKELEFADDLMSIMYNFSEKIYGSKIYKSKIKRAEENILEIKGEIVKD